MKLTIDALQDLLERERQLHERERLSVVRMRAASNAGSVKVLAGGTKIQKSMAVRATPELISGCISGGKQKFVFYFLQVYSCAV